MPTTDRKPRARRRPERAAEFESARACRDAIEGAAGDAEAWASLRPAVVRWLLQGNNLINDAALAGRIADVYYARPYYLRCGPPGASPA